MINLCACVCMCVHKYSTYVNYIKPLTLINILLNISKCKTVLSSTIKYGNQTATNARRLHSYAMKSFLHTEFGEYHCDSLMENHMMLSLSLQDLVARL